MHDGQSLIADFAKPEDDHHSSLCREHDGIEFCLETILDMYQAPHDCVMFGEEWICQDEMIHGWKEGCLEVNSHQLCGSSMVDLVLQNCIDIESKWVCPTAIGTKRTGYNNN